VSETHTPGAEPELARPARQVLYMALAVVIIIPGVTVRLTGTHLPEITAVVAFGVAIVGAAFLLSWAAEVVQLDIAAGLAIALLALIAVLPEYAVDFVFTWKAGTDPTYAPYALANMTGGNQLLIGVGWPLVVLLGTWRVRRHVRKNALPLMTGTDHVELEPGQAIDIAHLTLATIYGLTLPLRSSLTMVDFAVLVAIYVAYLIRLSKAPPEAPHLVGPAALLGTLPTTQRRLTNVALFVAAAAAILVCAEPFAESLLEVGREFGINEFLLVKWLAPLASESPELLVAALFAWRLRAPIGLGALVSSKVNQWTLLVGTLPLVYGMSSFSLNGLPLGIQQRDELLVTAAQSAFAVAVLANRTMSRPEAWVMLALFVGQFASSGVLPERYAAPGRIAVGAIFLLGAAWVLRKDFGRLRILVYDGLRRPVSELYADKSSL
jgi:cation:H+ antiporter